MTVTRKGTQTRNLAKGLPCSKQPTESLGNWVAEFDYSRLSSQVSSLSGYQAGMFDGEDAVWVVQFLVLLPW